MELLLLVLIAGLVGYWLANSRFRKTIDQTTEKVSDTSREAADRTEGWFRGLFSRKKPSDDTVDATFEEQTTPNKTSEGTQPEEVKPAEKTTSRRKSSKEDEDEGKSEE